MQDDNINEFFSNNQLDPTSPMFTAKLVEAFVDTILGEIESYGNFLNQYTEKAFDNSSNLGNHFNRYAFPIKTANLPAALNQPMLEFLQENNMFFFCALLEFIHTKQGYKDMVDTHIYYVAQWVNPQYIQYFARALAVKLNPKCSDNPEDIIGGNIYTLKEGIPRLLKEMIKKQKLIIQFEWKVIKVVHVVTKSGRKFF